ncbi:MAG: molybdenum cofactor guanylyltransferase [Armatimonadetes bacterium]|nr:molybdenum cofactor guanylyltransferase [Armatimonadota bacterium]
MKIEAALMTGGRSSRMGADKAGMDVRGEPAAHRTARLLNPYVTRVTVLGSHDVPGCLKLQDAEPFQGPLAALASFHPREDAVFVCSCDMPRFDATILPLLADRIEHHDSIMAVVPFIEGNMQPLCALYRTNAFAMIATVRAEGQRRVLSWIDTLWAEVLTEDDLRMADLDPRDFLSADTTDAWARAVTDLA